MGSTDIPADDPDEAVCTPEEVAYFMEALRDLLPGLRFDEGQIVYAYAGIRPLPNSEGVAPGLISRDHSAPVAEPEGDRPFPVIALIGGKWTTFRAFSAEVADRVLERLGHARRQGTDALRIGGGQDMPDEATRDGWIAETAAATGASPERVALLLDRYGSTARAVAAEEGRDPVLLRGTDLSEGEIRHIAGTEKVVHLEDIVLRRTTLGVTGQASRAVIARTAEVAGEVLGWDAARCGEEIAACTETLTRRHNAPPA